MERKKQTMTTKIKKNHIINNTTSILILFLVGVVITLTAVVLNQFCEQVKFNDPQIIYCIMFISFCCFIPYILKKI